MKISGIICEYNPLHNGHLYHLSQVREGGADGIVAVMSGNFVQRGDAAILDKFTRARLAIQAGVDLVLELPVPYALAPAENFAMGGVALLTALGNVDEISFGSESGDIQLLAQAAEACNICKTEYADVMDDFLRSGYSYPEVLSQMVSQLYDEETAAVLRQPNNTLAIAYLNAMEELGSPLHPVTIRRRGAGHNSQQPTENTASATYIRQFFAEGGDCRRMMPSYSWHALREADAEGHIGSMEYLERLILYKLRTTDPDEMHNIAEIGQGLEYRLYKAKRAASLSELLRTIQTKRYPMAKILGYRNREINQIYIVPTAIVVILSMFITIPVSNWAIGYICNYFFKEYPGYLPYYTAPSIFIKMAVLGVVSYAVIAFFQTRRVKKIPLADALKNVE